MSEFKICRICLRTEVKVYKYDRFQLKSFYEEVMALKVNDGDGLPQYFCYECAAVLHKFHRFKEKCYRGQRALKDILWRGPITYETVYKIDRKANNLQSELEIMNIGMRVKSYIVNNMNIVVKHNTGGNERLHGVSEDGTSTYDKEDKQNELEKNQAPCSPTIAFVNLKKECVKVEYDIIKERRKSKSSDDITQSKRRKLDVNQWKVYTLPEEEALREFRSRAEDQKYITAAYKCQACFKGFSKPDMLRRHTELRHSKEVGSFECRFCRMRFKWECHLRRHARQHYTRYRCLRCRLVCPLENTALLHEESHSGAAKRCAHCGDEFRHASTYYTHLRTHRSAHVCAACGASFVSAAGLHQHRRLRHAHPHDGGLQSASDSDGEGAGGARRHCALCGITFATARAHRAHLFHSAMHAHAASGEVDSDTGAPRKVLGKRMQAKIAKELGCRRADEEPPPPPPSLPTDGRRRRKVKRKLRKPTACHQCGQQFATQSACRRHHQAAHPRTSFHPPAERHVCELCGASLAPGSVAAHQNMHSRARTFACGDCARTFHSRVGLTRHALTHTGEKPFACTACDKRFTQSNSMKLHYRTFHLKQPYPKRDRTKKAKASRHNVQRERTTGQESNASAAGAGGGRGRGRGLPPHPAPPPHTPHTPTRDANTHAPGDDIHYLTLA